MVHRIEIFSQYFTQKTPPVLHAHPAGIDLFVDEVLRIHTMQFSCTRSTHLTKNRQGADGDSTERSNIPELNSLPKAGIFPSPILFIFPYIQYIKEIIF